MVHQAEETATKSRRSARRNLLPRSTFWSALPRRPASHETPFAPRRSGGRAKILKKSGLGCGVIRRASDLPDREGRAGG